METQDQNTNVRTPGRNGRILAGFFLLIVGAVFLMKETAFILIPDWLFTWPMILIAVGIYTGIKHEFRNPGWMIMVVVGAIFLADEAHLGFDFHRFIIPVVIIAAGLIMIIRPKTNSWKYRSCGNFRNRNWNAWAQPAVSPTAGQSKTAEDSSASQATFSSQDYFDSTSVFGGVKKIIVSKNFRGGDITCFMGGCEVDLTQADLQVPAVIDVTQIFGGTKLVVPSHWQVRTEMTAIFGSVEDKRQQPLTSNEGKLLILKGTSIFGGIEIKNY